MSAETGNVVMNRVALAARTSAEAWQLTDRYLAGTLRSYAGGDPLGTIVDDITLVGTPDAIVAQAERYRAAGVSHLFARVSLDEMPIEVAQQTIELFGSDVIPRVRRA
jgi:alkanesulfonate monooxygenase SsuD/methylene tetrahydromethanopterin reductase-like flavin-dependent oxidoreductase (luciferase family)